MIGIRIQSVDAVVATVAVSSVVTASLRHGHRRQMSMTRFHGKSASPSATEQTAAAPAREPLVERRYPMPETATGLALPLGFEDQRPALRSAPERGSGGGPARASAPDPRTVLAGDAHRAGRRPARGRRGGHLTRHSARACRHAAHADRPARRVRSPAPRSTPRPPWRQARFRSASVLARPRAPAPRPA